MDRAVAEAPFGQQLRRWRLQRRLSQLALALDAGVSARHLSWLETGRAQPSRAMVLRLTARLELPLRERNALLLAAGFAPMYAERAPSHPALGAALQAVQRLLDAHVPWPALAVDRHWNLVAANRMVPLLLQLLPEGLRAPPLNVLRATLHPQGLAPMIVNLADWREHVLARLQRQWAACGDPALATLLQELRALPAPPAPQATSAAAGPGDEVATTLVLETPHGRLAFVTTVTVFGAPHDVWLSELAIETLLPADAATAEALRRLHAAPG
jgi:transcriptional regulator with XRE-family HTH domain